MSPTGRKFDTPGWFETSSVDRVGAQDRERRPDLAERIGERLAPLRLRRQRGCRCRACRAARHCDGVRAIGSAEAVVHRPLVLASVVIGSNTAVSRVRFRKLVL